MAILVRMKGDHGTLWKGEDAAVTPEEARELQSNGFAWITGGDPFDFEAHGLTADSDVGEAVVYAPPGNSVGLEGDLSA